MNRKTLLLAASLLLPLLAFSYKVSTSVTNDGREGNKKVQWNTFDDGIALSAKQNKLLVIDFYTDWCHWCKVMDKDTYGNSNVAEYANEHVVLAKLNAETADKFAFKDAHYTGQELAMMFGVTGFPTTAFMNAKGELLTTVSGFIPPEKFRLILEFMSERLYEKMKFEEFEKQHAGTD